MRRVEWSEVVCRSSMIWIEMLVHRRVSEAQVRSRVLPLSCVGVPIGDVKER